MERGGDERWWWQTGAVRQQRGAHNVEDGPALHATVSRRWPNRLPWSDRVPWAVRRHRTGWRTARSAALLVGSTPGVVTKRHRASSKATR